MVNAVVKEAVNSRARVEQLGKEKAQNGGNINAESFSNSNSQAGMKGISHEIIQNLFLIYLSQLSS